MIILSNTDFDKVINVLEGNVNPIPTSENGTFFDFLR